MPIYRRRPAVLSGNAACRREQGPSPRNRHPQRQTSRDVRSFYPVNRGDLAETGSTSWPGQQRGETSSCPVPEHLPHFAGEPRMCSCGARRGALDDPRHARGRVFRIRVLASRFNSWPSTSTGWRTGTLKPGTLRIFSVCSSRSAPAPAHRRDADRVTRITPRPRGLLNRCLIPGAVGALCAALARRVRLLLAGTAGLTRRRSGSPSTAMIFSSTPVRTPSRALIFSATDGWR